MRQKEEKKNAKRKRREAELICKIEGSDAYKEADGWLVETFSIIQRKGNIIVTILDTIGWMLIIMIVITAIIAISSENVIWLILFPVSLACFIIFLHIYRFLFNPYKYSMRLLEYYSSHNNYHNHFAEEAIKRYIKGTPENSGSGVSYNGELLEIFKDIYNGR